MDLKALKSKTKSIQVEYEGEKVSVEYRPGELTGELVDAVTAAAGESGQSAVIAGALAKLVASWDVTSDGKAFPPTEANLLQLPMRLLVSMFTTLTQDAGPSPTSAAPSGSF